MKPTFMALPTGDMAMARLRWSALLALLLALPAASPASAHSTWEFSQEGDASPCDAPLETMHVIELHEWHLPISGQGALDPEAGDAADCYRLDLAPGAGTSFTAWLPEGMRLRVLDAARATLLEVQGEATGAVDAPEAPAFVEFSGAPGEYSAGFQAWSRPEVGITSLRATTPEPDVGVREVVVQLRATSYSRVNAYVWVEARHDDGSSRFVDFRYVEFPVRGEVEVSMRWIALGEIGRVRLDAHVMLAEGDDPRPHDNTLSIEASSPLDGPSTDATNVRFSEEVAGARVRAGTQVWQSEGNPGGIAYARAGTPEVGARAGAWVDAWICRDHFVPGSGPNACVPGPQGNVYVGWSDDLFP